MNAAILSADNMLSNKSQPFRLRSLRALLLVPALFLGVPKMTFAATEVAAPVQVKQLKPAEENKLKKALTGYFSAPTNRQAQWKFSGGLERLLLQNEPAVRAAAWVAFRDAPIHEPLRADFEAKRVRFEQYTSPFTVKTVGDRPPAGWALFIAMHGGGNTPKAVNDSQWRVMQRYYHDHPEAGGYLYVALRAPNDTWNGFYDDYVYPLIANLLREFTLFAGVNPDKVFILGYSHGGYGAFAIGPKMPDHFAAIHASAAAPTDGETTAKTLRNTVFTAMVGEKDTDYGRLDRCRKFDDAIQKLRGNRADIYPVTVRVIPGNGHTGLPDRDLIKEMYPATRNPAPRELSWLMTDNVIKDFYWLRIPQPAKEQEIDATCLDNRVTLTGTNATTVFVMLDRRLVDFDRPITFDINGKVSTVKLKPGLLTLCQTLAERGDPGLAFSTKTQVQF